MTMLLFRLFITFFKIGAFTLGGGYAMLPIIQDEVVDKKGWLTDEEFLDAIAVAQSSPGAIAVNTSIYIGYKINGIKGAIFSTLGTVIPSFTIIIIVVTFLYQYRDNAVVDRAFKGIRPAVVALILSSVYKLAKSANLKGKKIIISLGALFMIMVFNISPVWIILASILIGMKIEL